MCDEFVGFYTTVTAIKSNIRLKSPLINGKPQGFISSIADQKPAHYAGYRTVVGVSQLSSI